LGHGFTNGNPHAHTHKEMSEMRPHSPSTRDAALRRLASVNRWLIAGSAALTGLFAAVAATAFPGKTVKARASVTQDRKGGTSTRAHSGSSRLRAPAKAPESGESSATQGSGESSAPSEAERSTSTGESPSETTAEPTGEAPGETEKAVETEKPVEAAKAVESKVEAPVVSGGS
jgi:hypothetical protein